MYPDKTIFSTINRVLNVMIPLTDFVTFARRTVRVPSPLIVVLSAPLAIRSVAVTGAV